MSKKHDQEQPEQHDNRRDPPSVRIETVRGMPFAYREREEIDSYLGRGYQQCGGGRRRLPHRHHDD